MRAHFRVAESTVPKLRVRPSTEPSLSGEEVMVALGAELMGPSSECGGTTFSHIRERVASLFTERRPISFHREAVHFSEGVADSLRQLTAALQAEGVSITSPELAEFLVGISLQTFDSADLAAKLRERSKRVTISGQPT